MSDIARLQERLGYRFSDEGLLRRALTHTSYANEKLKGGHRDSNQRLEFLGDSALSIVISTYLYENFPDLPEGKLSRFRASLVCEDALADVGRSLDLGDYLLLGKGEEALGGGRKASIIADCVEAIIAAVYLDAGPEACGKFVLENLHFRELADRLTSSGNVTGGDFKTLLQETYREPAYKIVYTELSCTGPVHSPVFVCLAEVKDSRGNVILSAEAEGRSRKEAEQAAAGKILKKE